MEQRMGLLFFLLEVNVPSKDNATRATFSLCVRGTTFLPFIIISLYTSCACSHLPSLPYSLPPLLIHPPLRPRASHPLFCDQISHQAVPTRTITLESRPEAAAGKLHQSLPFQIGPVEGLWVKKRGKEGRRVRRQKDELG